MSDVIDVVVNDVVDVIGNCDGMGVDEMWKRLNVRWLVGVNIL